MAVGLVQVWVTGTELQGIGIVQYGLQLADLRFGRFGILIDLEIGGRGKDVFHPHRGQHR